MHTLTLIVRAAPPDENAWPLLARLARRGTALAAPRCASEAACMALGLQRQQDWPCAPRLAALMGLSPADGYWLRVDLVHLAVNLRGPSVQALLDLRPDEARALNDLVREACAAANLDFLADPAGGGFVRLERAPELRTTALDHVSGRSPLPWLPQGADAAFWQRWLHELQMALHAHPVNVAREAAGRPAANSAWVWGGGEVALMHTDAQPAPDRLWGASDALAARLLGVPARALPEDARSVWADAAAHAVVLLDADAVEGAHAAAWVERRWLRPALRAVRFGRVRVLRVLAVNQGGACVNTAQSWRFWR